MELYKQITEIGIHDIKASYQMGFCNDFVYWTLIEQPKDLLISYWK